MHNMCFHLWSKIMLDHSYNVQCHGESDEVVPVSRGKMANEILRKYADYLQFQTFAGMGHEATMEELQLVKDFIHKCTANYRDDH